MLDEFKVEFRISNFKIQNYQLLPHPDNFSIFNFQLIRVTVPLTVFQLLSLLSI